ncbi:MAG: NYN domain-containing protein [Oscillospiraceae bacterium]|nr:NYN domain-containing protein [Oscillospiraceae bacterium]
MKHIVLGILAHVDAGKTTLTEAMLYLSGRIRTLGRVDHRNSFLDNDDQERERGITIFSKQAMLQWNDLHVTLLDTPGHVDFSAEMERTLQILDYAVLVISGTDGVQAHTETLWNLLERYNTPTFVFITKMDASALGHETLMEDLQMHLGEGCIDMAAAEAEEAAAMLDEDVLNELLETGSVSAGSISRLIAERRLFPCYFGSGLKLDGVEEFLSALEAYTIEKKVPDAFGAKVYKILRDNKGRRLTCMRITGGSLSVRDTIRYLPLHGEAALEEKVAEMRCYSGLKYETIEKAEAGTVCSVIGLSGTWPGQGLGIEPDSGLPVLEPVLGYRLEFLKGTDLQAVLPRLRLLEEEDPTLHLVWEPALNEIQLQLMGTVQTEVLHNIIKERFDLDVTFSQGHILYKETIAATVEGVGHYEPLRHYAEVHLLLEPGEPGSGLIFDTVCSTDELDLNWQRLILTHLEEKEHRGVLTGSPITDMKITLTAGKAHLKHTEGGDFRQATYRAIRQGLMQAESILLEPYYRFRLEVPAEQIGRAISDIRMMGGEHGTPETMNGRTVLIGTAPAAAMAGYSSEVAAYTSGKGKFSCLPDGYRPCLNAKAVIEEAQYDPEKDLENSPDSIFCAHGAGFNVKWNQVPEYMHLPPTFKAAEGSINGQTAPSPAAADRNRNVSIDEKELEAIMEREFGPIRRRQYAVPTVNGKRDIRLSFQPRKERLIVDGYNLIFAWDDLKKLAADSLDSAREKLIERMINFSGFTGKETVLVFDAYKVSGGEGERYDSANLHIAYTRENESADLYIERLADEIGKDEAVRVVTSDSLIRLTALRAGVLRTSSKEFLSEVEDALQQMRAAPYIEKEDRK